MGVGVCSAITTWGESVSSTAESLRAADLGEDGLGDAVDDFESATSDFVDELQELGRPETEAGQQAEEALDKLSDDVEENVAQMKRAVDDVSGLGGIVEAVTIVSAALSTIGQQVSATFAKLDDQDAGDELELAFRQAESCNQLESS